ncbi:sugar phosphate isomerase/epimerase family protein [Pseudonocardia sp. T1-2H]|uniref:sugar phosphate isomerase/epimerase family protein n=1 Tax=Pseudonocardia sp. T1-2H TaxID=3128899 RepID=UPI0031016BF8
MAERAPDPEFVASFFTLTGAGFGEPPRHGFAARCEAAAAAGFTGIGLHVDDLARTVAGGLDVDDMRDVLAAAGLRVVEIEFLAGWALDDEGPGGEGVAAVAEAFGGRHVSAGEFRGGELDPVAAAKRLAEAAGRAAERDLLVAVEAFPWSAIRDYGTAVDLVRRSGAPNAGLLVDVWHFFNGGASPTCSRTCPERAWRRSSSTTARGSTTTSWSTPAPPGGCRGRASSTSSGWSRRWNGRGSRAPTASR